MFPIFAFFMFASMALVFGSEEGDPSPSEAPVSDDTTDRAEDREVAPPTHEHEMDENPDALEEFDPSNFEGVLPNGPVERYVSGEADGFNIEIEFDGRWTEEQQQGVVIAAEFLSAAIVEDVPDYAGNGGIDDLKITAYMENLDGSGGNLAYASVGAIRADSHLPAEAMMVFDRADVGYLQGINGWVSTIVHEMLHGLGFGTVWDQMGLVEGSVSEGDPRFTGDNATQVYNDQFDKAARDPGAAIGVPIEADGPATQAGGHWDEMQFGNELMTGQLSGREFLSDLTWAALEDMGYDTLFDDKSDANDAHGALPVMPV